MHYFLAIYTSKTNYLMPGNGRFALKKLPFYDAKDSILSCKRQYFVIQKTLFDYAKGYISSFYVNIIYLKD